MTKNQYKLLAFIKAYLEEHGYSPSYEEMRVGMEASSRSAIHRWVRALVASGDIRYRPGRARTIELADDRSLAIGYLSDKELALEARKRHLVLCHRLRDAFGGITYEEIPT